MPLLGEQGRGRQISERRRAGRAAPMARNPRRLERRRAKGKRSSGRDASFLAKRVAEMWPVVSHDSLPLWSLHQAALAAAPAKILVLWAHVHGSPSGRVFGQRRRPCFGRGDGASEREGIRAAAAACFGWAARRTKSQMSESRGGGNEGPRTRRRRPKLTAGWGGVWQPWAFVMLLPGK